jgi:AraC-like DNA-binding protein
MKRIFHLTPGQLITRSRINSAAQALGETRRSVAEIALACGFCDHSAFTRAFRQATGMTPTQFRESV